MGSVSAGLDLNDIAEGTESGDGVWIPQMSPSVSNLMGTSPLVRGMSGSGLGRLHRVGSIPLSDMNRHSLSQVSHPNTAEYFMSTTAFGEV